MSNNEAEKQGESILKRGANVIDNMRNQKRTWDKSRTTGHQRTKDLKSSTLKSKR